LTHREDVSTVNEVDEVLQVLEDGERALSRRRARLHAQIDFLHSGGYAHVDVAPEFARLRSLERDLSDRRRRLHGDIDAARREQVRRRDTAA
jgi:hypothetical protein